MRLKELTMAADRCPWCGHELDRASIIGPQEEASSPEAGDLSVCIDCGNWLVFAENLDLRKCTTEDLKEFDAESVMRMVEMSRLVARMNER